MRSDSPFSPSSHHPEWMLDQSNRIPTRWARCGARIAGSRVEFCISINHAINGTPAPMLYQTLHHSIVEH